MIRKVLLVLFAFLTLSASVTPADAQYYHHRRHFHHRHCFYRHHRRFCR